MVGATANQGIIPDPAVMTSKNAAVLVGAHNDPFFPQYKLIRFRSSLRNWLYVEMYNSRFRSTICITKQHINKNVEVQKKITMRTAEKSDLGWIYVKSTKENPYSMKLIGKKTMKLAHGSSRFLGSIQISVYEGFHLIG